MTTSEKILKAREKRHKDIGRMLHQYDTVISMRVNFPGQDKNHPLAHLILNGVSLSELNIDIKKKTYHQSIDGPYYLLVTDENPGPVKEKTIVFEDQHPLGRLMDVDVYHKQAQLSRQTKRQCFICDKAAHVCVRNKTHTLEELLEYIRSITFEYFDSMLYHWMDDAILQELNLDPKFGLVTPKTSGSHHDMNYDLMIRAKDAFLPWMIKAFHEGVQVEEINPSSMQALIDLGKHAEQAMYTATGGVNAYKGLIFHLGLLSFVYGFNFSRDHDKAFISLIQDISSSIFDAQSSSEMTFGQRVNQRYHIKGARGEALNGYPHPRKMLETHKIEYLLDILIDLIVEVEDTNLLKRAKSLENYQAVKDEFRLVDKMNMQKLQELSKKCIEEGLSFGGSADLLVVTIFMNHMIKKHDNIYL